MDWGPAEWAIHPAPAAITAARPAPMQSAAIPVPSVGKSLKSPTNVVHVSEKSKVLFNLLEFIGRTMGHVK